MALLFEIGEVNWLLSGAANSDRRLTYATSTPGSTIEMDLLAYETYVIDNIDNTDLTISVKTDTGGAFDLSLGKTEFGTADIIFPADWVFVNPLPDFTEPGVRHLLHGIISDNSITVSYEGATNSDGSVEPPPIDPPPIDPPIPPDDIVYEGEVAILGDYGAVENDHDTVADLLLGRDSADLLDLTILAGDNGYNSGTYAEVDAAVYAIRALIGDLTGVGKVVGIPGNHDHERTDPVPGDLTPLVGLVGNWEWWVKPVMALEADPDDSWEAVGFIPTEVDGWAPHISKFGYGYDGVVYDSENPVYYGDNDDDKAPLQLCRHAFVATGNIPDNAVLYVTFVADDGCEIKLNGQVIMQYNRVFNPGSWPDGNRGSIVTTGTAFTAGFGQENKTYGFYVPASLLVAGTNVLTATVYQNISVTGSVTSSDMLFGCGIDWTTEFPKDMQTHGYGSGFLQRMPYISTLGGTDTGYGGGNTGSMYTSTVGYVKYHHLDSGWDNGRDMHNPGWCDVNSIQAEWLRHSIDPTCVNFVVIHHSPMSFSSGRGYSELNWLTEVAGLHGLLVGHDHQDYLVENVENGFIVVGTSLVGRASRANEGFETTAEGTWAIRKTHVHNNDAIVTLITAGDAGGGQLGYRIQKMGGNVATQGEVLFEFFKTVTVTVTVL